METLKAVVLHSPTKTKPRRRLMSLYLTVIIAMQTFYKMVLKCLICHDCNTVERVRLGSRARAW